MSNFYPIINVEAENEHFQICDLLISWIEQQKCCEDTDGTQETSYSLSDFLPSTTVEHQLMATGVAWNLVHSFNAKRGHAFERPQLQSQNDKPKVSLGAAITEGLLPNCYQKIDSTLLSDSLKSDNNEIVGQIKIRGNDEWAPPRPQIIFNIPEETNFRKLMQRQNYRCAGCGTKIDLELARRLVLYCHYLGKYFCKCCFSYKAIHLPAYILKKWDFYKYQVSHFALQLLDRLANEPLFNVNDINPSLYRKVKKLRQLLDVRMQLYYLQIYISTCTQTEKLYAEYTSFAHQHLLQNEVHLYSLNNLIELQHGKLYEYLQDLVVRSVAHIAECDRCRAKGHYCQLCGPSSLMTSLILNNKPDSEDNHQSTENLNENDSKMNDLKDLSNNISNISVSSESVTAPKGSSIARTKISNNTTANSSPTNAQSPNVLNFGASTILSINIDDPELIFPFEIGRVAQCGACGCCFHLQCFVDADRKCPKCERLQRRRTQISSSSELAGKSSEN